MFPHGISDLAGVCVIYVSVSTFLELINLN
jgi:hypothetical protein